MTNLETLLESAREFVRESNIMLKAAAKVAEDSDGYLGFVDYDEIKLDVHDEAFDRLEAIVLAKVEPDYAVLGSCGCTDYHMADCPIRNSY